MKRVREPRESLGRVATPKSLASPTAEARSKRGRQQQQQAERLLLASSEEQGEEHAGPFESLLAAGGVVWAKVGQGSRGGFVCRCNPAKLRLCVEKALEHDRTRRQEFVEVRYHASFKKYFV